MNQYEKNMQYLKNLKKKPANTKPELCKRLLDMVSSDTYLFFRKQLERKLETMTVGDVLNFLDLFTLFNKLPETKENVSLKISTISMNEEEIRNVISRLELEVIDQEFGPTKKSLKLD